MKHFTALLSVAATFVMCCAGSVAAHHAFAAEYDGTKPLTLKGTIVKMEWVNPHSWLHIETKTPEGAVETWALEFASINGLYRRGVKRTDLPVGAEVTVQGFAARNGAKVARALDVVLKDGRKLFAAEAPSAAPTEP